jgi:phage/plasmid-associated DNA primase
MEEYRVETDQIYSYIKECFKQYEAEESGALSTSRVIHGLKLIYNEKSRIPTQFIYQHYCDWAKETGISPMQQRNFISKLAEKLKTKSSTQRVNVLHVERAYGSQELRMGYTNKTIKCIVGFEILSDIKITVNGMNVSVMETIQQGEH